MLVIQNATLFTPEPLDYRADLFIEAERITRITPHGQVEPPVNARQIDVSGLQLVPGFIDLQLNGAFGHDFTAKPETIWPVSAELPRFGVTSYLPTIITSPLETVAAAQAVLLRQRPADFSGAEPLGLHVEGPFLNPQKKGAHNPAYLRRPDPDLITNWSVSQGVRLVTLAPELPGALELVQQLVEQGVLVSAGHSLASFEEARAGLRAGVRYGTHLFNAMPPLSHREPGLAGALLNDTHSVVGLIPDGIHVHPAMVKLAWTAKGSAGLNLVSDAMAALGMPPGRYHLNDFDVHVSQTDARLADGTLAGSILPLDAAVRNLLEYTGCSLSEALATVTTTPADLLGLSQQRGRIAPGLLADLVLLTPDFEVAMTISAGQITYKNQALEVGI